MAFLPRSCAALAVCLLLFILLLYIQDLPKLSWSVDNYYEAWTRSWQQKLEIRFSCNTEEEFYAVIRRQTIA